MNRTRIAVLGAALIALVLLVLAVRGHWSPLRTLDLAVLRRLNSFTAPRPGLASFWRGVSTVGEPLTFQTLSVVTGAVLALRGRLRLGLFVAVTVLGAGLLSTAVKLIVDRPRPRPAVVLATAKGQSFPSGHALASATAMTVAAVLAWLVWRGGRAVIVTVVAALVALTVAASRLSLGVHNVSDVLGAWLIAAAWVTGMTLAFRVDRDALSDRRVRASA